MISTTKRQSAMIPPISALFALRSCCGVSCAFFCFITMGTAIPIAPNAGQIPIVHIPIIDIVNAKDKSFCTLEKDYPGTGEFYNKLDCIYFPKDIDINKLSSQEILKSYVLIRNIKQYEPKKFIKHYNVIKLTYKYKDIAQNGDIISQEKKECEIKNLQDGNDFLIAIGYKQLMKIHEDDIVFGKEDLKIAIKTLEDGNNLLEVETIENNNSLDTVDKLKQKIIELDLPIDKSDFFIKKAEIKLKKILGG